MTFEAAGQGFWDKFGTMGQRNIAMLSQTPMNNYLDNCLIRKGLMVAREGIEPPTRGFSVRCSTN